MFLLYWLLLIDSPLNPISYSKSFSSCTRSWIIRPHFISKFSCLITLSCLHSMGYSEEWQRGRHDRTHYRTACLHRPRQRYFILKKQTVSISVFHVFNLQHSRKFALNHLRKFTVKIFYKKPPKVKLKVFIQQFKRADQSAPGLHYHRDLRKRFICSSERTILLQILQK